MIEDLVAETAASMTGDTTAYSVTGAADLGFGRFRAYRSNAASILAMAMTTPTSPNGFKSEKFRGVLGIGGDLTDTITRVKVYRSMIAGVVSTSAVNWQADDSIIVFWATPNQALAPLIHQWETVAANRTVVADDVGRVLKFDLASNRICQMPDLNTVDEFFSIGIYGKTGANNIQVTPYTGQYVNDSAVSTAVNVAAGTLKWVHADFADLTWRITG